MADWVVLDKAGNRWDYTSSKAAASSSKVELGKRQKIFGPFRVEEVEA